eukprot:7256811-Ditylum_brightwellii.AAC.1
MDILLNEKKTFIIGTKQMTRLSLYLPNTYCKLTTEDNDPSRNEFSSPTRKLKPCVPCACKVDNRTNTTEFFMALFFA